MYYGFKKYLLKISGKSGYDMISGIKEFYDTLPREKPPYSRTADIRRRGCFAYCRMLVEAGVEKKIPKGVSKHDTKTLDGWAGIDTWRKMKTATNSVDDALFG